jgi:tetratricopeptide (TPR) repeat protein
VQRGICHRELGETALAVADFSRCVGLRPDFAWGHFNLGSTLEHAGHRGRAIASYAAALRHDPGFTLAYLNRGLALLDQKEFRAALDDFTKAAGLGRDDTLLHGGRGAALEGLGRGSEADAAFAVAFARSNETPALQLPLRLRYGFSVYKRLPDKARQAFAEVLRQQPQHPQALYGRAMILVEQGEERKAVAVFTKALDAHPGFTDARRFRAVLLARSGDLGGAGRDINRCLEQEPGAGVTLYAAACVLALGAEKTADQGEATRLADQALEFLRRAFARGYGRDTAAADPDLRALRRRPEFQRLLEGL